MKKIELNPKEKFDKLIADNFPKQYSTNGNANRAIDNFVKKHKIPKQYQGVIEQLDYGCYEVSFSFIRPSLQGK
jgi:hypothetical protein